MVRNLPFWYIMGVAGAGSLPTSLANSLALRNAWMLAAATWIGFDVISADGLGEIGLESFLIGCRKRSVTILGSERLLNGFFMHDSGRRRRYSLTSVHSSKLNFASRFRRLWAPGMRMRDLRLWGLLSWGCRSEERGGRVAA